MTATTPAEPMLRLMDRATSYWRIPVIGKEHDLDYLRRLEPKLSPGAVVVADNTKRFARELRAYLAHVRRSGRYESREHDFGSDAMEVSIARGPVGVGVEGRRRPIGAGAGPALQRRGPAGTNRAAGPLPLQVRLTATADR